MITYNQITFADAKTRLAGLLGDPNKVHWTDTELGLYIIEALRFWGLAAQYWRETAIVTTVAGQAWYDLTTDVTDLGGNLLQDLSVTDRDVLTDICYSLIEPVPSPWSSGWIGTEMFTLEELTDILEHSRDALLSLSGCYAQQQSFVATAGQSLLDLNSDVIEILRAAVANISGQLTPIWPVDQWQLQATAGLPTTGRPKAYSVYFTPQLSINLAPTPSNSATVALKVIKVGANLDPASSATSIGFPDDACWLLKYRTIDDVLSGDGLARAPQLAQYCTQRWEHGLSLLNQYQSILWSTVNGRRMSISSVAQLDAQRATWEYAANTGTPSKIHLLNWNLFAVSPIPDGTYTLTLEIIRKAPIPTDDADYLQISPAHYQSILDYAQHIALFKSQGAEFAESQALLKDCIAAADDYRSRQAAGGVNWLQQQRLTRQDREMRPYRSKAQADEADAMAGVGETNG